MCYSIVWLTDAIVFSFKTVVFISNSGVDILSVKGDLVIIGFERSWSDQVKIIIFNDSVID